MKKQELIQYLENRIYKHLNEAENSFEKYSTKHLQLINTEFNLGKAFEALDILQDINIAEWYKMAKKTDEQREKIINKVIQL